jgi:diphthine-ammonia ligase
MKFIALVSGGKDSIYSILQAVQNGHELVGCLHLGAPIVTEEESYMYQTAASEVVQTLVEECLGVPLVIYQRRGKSLHTGLVYDIGSNSSNGGSPSNSTIGNSDDAQDEVEDLYRALVEAQERFHGGNSFQAVSSGAILSTYQRVRIEHVCSRLGLTSLSYLWRLAPQKELLSRMLEEGMEPILVKTACPPGLVPRKHLNRPLRELWDSGLLDRLHQRYQFHFCGEGGEYESLVLDSPLYRRKLVLDEVEIVEADEDDGVGELRILRCHTEDKDDNDIPILSSWTESRRLAQSDVVAGVGDEPKVTPTTAAATTTTTATTTSETDNHAKTSERGHQSIDKVSSPMVSIVGLPHVCRGTGGFLHFSEIMAPAAAKSFSPFSVQSQSEAELAVHEALAVFAILGRSLRAHGATAQDVLFVHLYLSEISHFGNINAHYENFFGTVLPPSRSCVAVGCGVLPGCRRVLLDCMVQIGSGGYMRSSLPQNHYAVAAHATKTSKLREVLHVQSISHWAPVCVGPYSQANTLRSGLHFLAGQIGLIPAAMTLRPTWRTQLEQCWRNVAAVLDALDGGSLANLLASLIYVSDTVYQEDESMDVLESVSTHQILTNGSIVAGRVDSSIDSSEQQYGGYEDEGTWKEMDSGDDDWKLKVVPCPTLIVSIPEMPKEAVVEVEVVALSTSATRTLDFRDAQYTMACTGQKTSTDSAPTTGWETGHDFPSRYPQAVNEMLQIDACSRVIGHGCASVALCVASLPVESAAKHHDIDLESMISDMLFAVEKVLAEARAGLYLRNSIHIRLFFVSTEQSSGGRVIDDGVQLRSLLRAAVASKIGTNTTATTAVPVRAINTSCWTARTIGSGLAVFAMQILMVDPVHFETELWIHKDRQYYN